MMVKPSFTSLKMSFFALIIIYAMPADAQLSVSPERINLSSDNASETVEILNTASDQRTYVLEWRELDDDEASINPPAPSNAIQRASDFIRYSPRQVTLAPNESQTVRLLLQLPAEATSGEYRSILRFSGQEVAQELTYSAGEGMDGNVSVGFRIAYGMPVTVQIGN